MDNIKLACGCEVNQDGQFILGQGCIDRNCGECRTIAKLHPFGKKRFTDILFRLE